MFSEPEFFWATVDAVLQKGLLSAQHVPAPVPLDSITHFLGTYDYLVTSTSLGTVRFQVDNVTDLSSGTRISAEFGGVSLEAYRQNPTAYQDRPLLSILEEKPRHETIDPEGGGTMRQTFVWEERYVSWAGCLNWFPPFPIGLMFVEMVEG